MTSWTKGLFHNVGPIGLLINHWIVSDVKNLHGDTKATPLIHIVQTIFQLYTSSDRVK